MLVSIMLSCSKATYTMHIQSTALLLLVLSSSSVNVVLSSVYYITPNSGNTSNNTNCLNYCVALSAQYLTSHTQLKLLSGIHHLNMAITIQDVDNFSLSGTLTPNGTIDTVVKCDKSGQAGGIIISNSTFTTIKNLIINNCTTQLKDFLSSNIQTILWHKNISAISNTLLIQNSYSIIVQQLIMLTTCTYDIILDNIFSNSSLSGVFSKSILVLYSGYDTVAQNPKHKLVITDYHPDNNNNEWYKIEIILFNHPYHIEILLSHIEFLVQNAISIKTLTCSGLNQLKIYNCKFSNIKSHSLTSVIFVESGTNLCGNINRRRNLVEILDCHFTNNTKYKTKNSNMIEACVTDSQDFNFIILYIYALLIVHFKTIETFLF